MAVSITTIQGTDNVALSRLTINANFSALKAASDAVTALLDPSTYILSGVKSVQIDNSAVALSSTILSVSKSASILGNLTLGSLAQATTVTINGTGGVSLLNSSLTLGSGSLTMSSTSSLLTQNGNFLLGGQYRSTGLNTAYSNIVSLTTEGTTAVTVTGTYNNKYLFMTNGSTASYASTGLTASLSAGTNGQVVEIFHVKGEGPVNISTTNFWGMESGVPIVMTETGDKVTCVYENGSWFLWNVDPLYTGTTGIGSITYSRSL